MLCSDCAQQRHKIIRNGVALAGKESVSVGYRRHPLLGQPGDPTMRIYVISNDGIALCREVPAALNDGEIVVTSKEELHAASLNGKQLLALWNALPGAEK